MKINQQDYILFGILGLVILIVIIGLVVFYIKKRRNRIDMQIRWKYLQKLLANKTNWRDVIIQADKLLDETLKLKHFKGKTTGERLMSAQHQLTANDRVWFSHKLYNKLIYEEDIDITKSQVKKCLLGYWQALKDLGAFNKDEK